jgi:glutamate synthase (NADPH) large chain
MQNRPMHTRAIDSRPVDSKDVTPDPPQAETGSANYDRRARASIQAMASIGADDRQRNSALLNELLVPRENPFPPGRPAHIDDVVFLSAALTRLVIDPYRESCDTRTRITRTREVGYNHLPGAAVTLSQPFCCTGFDDAPEDIRRVLAGSLSETGCGYVGRAPLIADPDGHPKSLKWFQLLSTDDPPDPAADALIYFAGGAGKRSAMRRQHPDQLLGLCVSAAGLPEAIPWALEHQLDLLLLDGTGGIDKPWSELRAQPDLTVMRDAIRLLREANMEEEIALLYFGGMRSGTDVAKALALNCNAAVFGVAMALALGGTIAGDTITFDADEEIDPVERQQGATNWIKASAQETAIIARCTGKTDVHNLEPEDMRSITLSTAEALNLPLASGQAKREWF